MKGPSMSKCPRPRITETVQNKHKPQYEIERIVQEEIWRYVSFSKKAWGNEIPCYLQGSVKMKSLDFFSKL